MIVIFYGTYVFAIGLVGLARAGSFTPLFVNGAIAAVTIWLGWLLGKGLRSVRGATIAWLVVNTAGLAYMAFEQIGAHAKSDTGSVFIFGSMALFALVSLLFVWRADPRRWLRNGLRSTNR